MMLIKRWRSIERWRTIDPAWRFAIGAYLIVRVWWTAWTLLIFALFPVVLQNVAVPGDGPALAVFSLATGERYVYSGLSNAITPACATDTAVLGFRPSDPGFAIDTQTGSVWSWRDGRARTGRCEGSTLGIFTRPVEDIFPYRGVPPETNPLVSVWQRFDTNWFLKIAEHGYAGDDGSTVYLPLYPILIRVVGGVVGNSMVAALVISNLALIGALALLYRLTESLFNVSIARRTIAYLLIFPTGFFLLAAYTESLFLFLTLGAFFFARHERWYVATLLGVLAALTRLQGVLLIVPLAWMLWAQVQVAGDKSQGVGRTSHASRFTRYASRGLPLLLIPLTTVSFLTFTNLSLVASYTSQLNAVFVFPWENLFASVARLMTPEKSFIDALNLLVTLLLGMMLVAIWKKMPSEYALYSLLMILAPLLRMTTTQPLVSMSRYALAVFPMFIVWGTWGKNPWLNRAILYLGFPLQLFLCAQFVLWGWVG